MTNAAIDLLIDPKPKDLGGFEVRRVLPFVHRRSVGPFVFFDHLGPADFAPGTGIDVRPHPHIGLATVTYLFEGQLDHRDNLGFVQRILPGDVNWMTAGRGIVHSERTGPEARAAGHRVHGLQSWVALPRTHEETEPSFVHHPKDTLPGIEGDGVSLRIIAGSAFGHTSPVAVLHPTLYVGAHLEPGSRLAIDTTYEERAIYVASGRATINGTAVEAGRMAILTPDRSVDLHATEATHAMILGGAPMDGPRKIWWNFVSSSPERIERAKDDWRAGRFAPVPGETEFIPLPE